MIKPGMFISDRYEIIDKVGTGGMADVYKAKCHRLNRYVAIKVLKTEFSGDKSFVNKFRGEAQSAAGLSHPNIVNVYDVGDDDGLHYIVMELVEGITLKRFIERKGKLEVKEAIGIAIQIAQGMEAAHTNHIIHRDIKPQNIIISKEGKVKVTDFGIAKATTSNTITSNAMGSVHYLSPEQARGGYSDEKSDIYSLGVTMYEMLSGQVPFAGDTNVSVALLHIQKEAVPLSEIVPDIPLSIDKIVQKCMQKKPERRYLSVSDLVVDLKKAIANPNGDFVKLATPLVTDSPTIHLSDDDLERIKNGSHSTTNPTRMPVNRNDEIEEEEEELDAVDPRVAKILIGIAIPAGIVVFILICVFLGKLFTSFGSFGEKNKDNNSQIEENIDDITQTLTPTPSVTPEVSTVFQLPDLSGKTSQEAEAALRKVSETLIFYPQEEYSDTMEAGKVISQDPVAGSEVEQNTKVIVTISAGSEPFKLPNLVKLTDQQATTKIQELELKVSHEYDYSDTVEEGKVISTTPKADTNVKKGDTVTIVVSNGPEYKEVSVPLLVGLMEDEAISALESVGLSVGKISYGSSSEYSEGQVKYQSYSHGEKVKEGTKVDITLSTGPEVTPTPTPEVTPTPEEESTETSSGHVVRYVGKVVIDENPFKNEGDSGEIILELHQDGKGNTIYEEDLTYNSFPLAISDIEGSSSKPGTIVMYINGTKYDEKTWTVSFKEVKE